MREAGIRSRVPIHVEENGYPTGPARTYGDQRSALESMVGAVNAYRANYNVTNYFWFDLRDADSGSPNFQQQYGLLRDDYSPKPAFESYRALVDRLSVRTPVLLRASCYRHGVLARLRGSGVPQVRWVAFRALGREASDHHAPFGRHMRLAATRRAVRIPVSAEVTFAAGPVERLSRSVRCRIYDDWGR